VNQSGLFLCEYFVGWGIFWGAICIGLNVQSIPHHNSLQCNLLFSCITLDLQSGLLLWGFLTIIFYIFLIFPHMHRPFHSSQSSCPNNIRWEVQIMKCLILLWLHCNPQNKKMSDYRVVMLYRDNVYYKLASCISDVRFSQWWLRRILSASSSPVFLGNVGEPLDYMASHPRR
jgi:hypothetical protein